MFYNRTNKKIAGQTGIFAGTEPNAPRTSTTTDYKDEHDSQTSEFGLIARDQCAVGEGVAGDCFDWSSPDFGGFIFFN